MSGGGSGDGGTGMTDEPESGAPAGTGSAAVDGALGRLADLDGLPVARHVEVFEDVHDRLQHALADLDPR